eukprot:UN15983
MVKHFTEDPPGSGSLLFHNNACGSSLYLNSG